MMTWTLVITLELSRATMRAWLPVVLALALCYVSQVWADPVKPDWPVKFDVPFGLSVEGNVSNGNPPIVNSTSHFWYDYTQKAQLIVYPDTCLPGILPPALQHLGCNLLFNPNGTYLIAEKLGVCCLLFPGVGAVPPDFLAGFNATNLVMPAQDIFGVPHPTNFWSTNEGFYYWTDVNTMQDIQLVDGGIIMWNFVPVFSFDSGLTFFFRSNNAQAANLYSLPFSSCSKACTAQSSRMVIDPMTRMSHFYSGVSIPANAVTRNTLGTN